MNNSQIAQGSGEKGTPPIDRTPWLRQREGDLASIIEAIGAVEGTDAWRTLKRHVFDGLEETLERRISAEAKADRVNESELYRLQGQLVWAKKFSDFNRLSEFFRAELSGIRQQLKN